MTEIMLKSYEVLDAFKEEISFKEMIRLNQIIHQNYQGLIQTFQKVKEAYQKIMDEGGSYHPDYKACVKALQEAKKTLYETPEVSLYFKHEQAFQKQLNTFLSEVTQAISPYLKTPNELGIIAKGGSCHHGN